LAIPSTDGLGAVLELPPLRSWPSQMGKRLQRDTFVLDCIVRPPGLQATTEITLGGGCRMRWRTALYFTSGSVPEPIRGWHAPGRRQFALRAIAGERPAEGRAATTRLALWLPRVPAVERPTEVAAPYSSAFRARNSDLAGEPVVRIAIARAGGSDDLLMAYLYCPQRSSAPNV
jgi:hypothetical protein